MEKNKNRRGGHVSPFSTYALSDPDRKRKDTKATRPSEEAVREAKDWVDHNKK